MDMAKQCANCGKYEDSLEKPFENWNPESNKFYCSNACDVAGYLELHPESTVALTRLYTNLSAALKSVDDDQEIDTILTKLGITVFHPLAHQIQSLREELGAVDDRDPDWLVTAKAA